MTNGNGSGGYPNVGIVPTMGFQGGGEMPEEEAQRPYQVAGTFGKNLIDSFAAPEGYSETPDTRPKGRTDTPPTWAELGTMRESQLAKDAGIDDLRSGYGRYPVPNFDRLPAPMPQDPRMLAYRNQGVVRHLAQREQEHRLAAAQPPAPQNGGVISTRATQRVPTGYGPSLSDRIYGSFSAPFRQRRQQEPGYQSGGYVGGYGYDEDIEEQGADDATIDPMQFVQGALNYGKRQYGIPTEDTPEYGFQEGGVVPMRQDPAVTAQGNPNAIDPRRAMAYLSGDGAVSPEIAQALEQRVDPEGQMSPTQRAMTAIAVAPTDEARFGLLQHYRSKYNSYSAASKAALQGGDLGEAARAATMAMNNVPDGNNTAFAPGPGGGLVMIQRPAFGGGGGEPQQAAPVEQSFYDGGPVEDEEDEEVLQRMQPQPYGEPVEDEEVLQRMQPDPSGEYTPPPADVPDVAVPEETPVTNAALTMPVQSITGQQLAEMLNGGFDGKLEGQKGIGGNWLPPKGLRTDPARQAGKEQTEQTPLFQPPGSGASQAWRGIDPALDQADILDAADAERAAQAQGWDSAAEKAGPGFLSKAWERLKQGPGSIGALDVPPATTGSEAATRTPEEGVVPTTAAPATGGGTGPVLDEDRVNPFTGKVRAPAPGTVGSRAQAAGEAPRGVVPTAPIAAPAAYRTSSPAAGMTAPPRDGKTLDALIEERQQNAMQGSGYTSIPPAGAAPSRYELEEARRNLQQRTNKIYWQNITHKQMEDEVERVREARRNEILDGAAERAEKDYNRMNPSTAQGGGRGGAAAKPAPMSELEKKYRDRLRIATDIASRMTWSSYDDRNKYIAKVMLELEDRETKFGQEEIKGEKARISALGQIDKQDIINQRIRDEGEANRKSREGIAERNLAALRHRTIARMKMDAAIRTNSNAVSLIKSLIAANPGKSPFEMQKELAPHLHKLGIRIEDADAAVETLFGINTDMPAGGGGGGGGARAPDSTGAAADRGLATGAAIPGTNIKTGRPVTRYVGPDGNYWTKPEYERRFGPVEE